jgi:hypothetical protein
MTALGAAVLIELYLCGLGAAAGQVHRRCDR